MKTSLIVLVFSLIANLSYSQQSKYVEYLADSINYDTPKFLNLPVDSGFNALERIVISNDGKRLFYGVRNGYDSTSIAKINSIQFNGGKWSDPSDVMPSKSGAPSLSPDNKTLFFQFDHPNNPKGVFSSQMKSGWDKPKLFIEKFKESHYLQNPINNVYYFSAEIEGKKNIRDIYRVEVCNKDTITKKLNFNLKGNCCIDFFVPEDESYLLLTIYQNENKDKFKFYGQIDLFISFKDENGHWLKPVNIGEKINGLSEWTWGPYVTNDNKYLMFSSWTKSLGVYVIKFDKILHSHRRNMH